jgi:hypothetical protein
VQIEFEKGFPLGFHHIIVVELHENCKGFNRPDIARPKVKPGTLKQVVLSRKNRSPDPLPFAAFNGQTATGKG